MFLRVLGLLCFIVHLVLYILYRLSCPFNYSISLSVLCRLFVCFMGPPCYKVVIKFHIWKIHHNPSYKRQQYALSASSTLRPICISNCKRTISESANLIYINDVGDDDDDSAYTVVFKGPFAVLIPMPRRRSTIALMTTFINDLLLPQQTVQISCQSCPFEQYAFWQSNNCCPK